MISGLPNLLYAKLHWGKVVIGKGLMVFMEGHFHSRAWKVPEEAEPFRDGLWKWNVTSSGGDRGCIRGDSPCPVKAWSLDGLLMFGNSKLPLGYSEKSHKRKV